MINVLDVMAQEVELKRVDHLQETNPEMSKEEL
jgi:hypothetical protein